MCIFLYLEGEGTYKYKNGDVAKGVWKNGKKHGLVEIRYRNGDVFKGNFQYDRIEGQGELKCKSGFHYNGEWKMNLVCCYCYVKGSFKNT